jgi:hypothetical protein
VLAKDWGQTVFFRLGSDHLLQSIDVECEKSDFRLGCEAVFAEWHQPT